MTALAVLLAGAFVSALVASAGAPGVMYALLFALAVTPGLPIGIALFGPRHPAAWLGGALIGYGLTQLALWAAIVAGLASPLGFVLAWAVMLASGLGAGHLMSRATRLPWLSWPEGDLRALLLVLLLVPVLMGLTYRNLGREDGSGNRYYRAYFTADFVWHSALAYELGQVLAAAAESLPRPSVDELLLDLLPVTVRLQRSSRRQPWTRPTCSRISRRTRSWSAG